MEKSNKNDREGKKLPKRTTKETGNFAWVIAAPSMERLYYSLFDIIFFSKQIVSKYTFSLRWLFYIDIFIYQESVRNNNLEKIREKIAGAVKVSLEGYGNGRYLSFRLRSLTYKLPFTPKMISYNEINNIT